MRAVAAIARLRIPCTQNPKCREKRPAGRAPDDV